MCPSTRAIDRPCVSSLRNQLGFAENASSAILDFRTSVTAVSGTLCCPRLWGEREKKTRFIYHGEHLAVAWPHRVTGWFATVWIIQRQKLVEAKAVVCFPRLLRPVSQNCVSSATAVWVESGGGGGCGRAAFCAVCVSREYLASTSWEIFLPVQRTRSDTRLSRSPVCQRNCVQRENAHTITHLLKPNSA